MDIQLKRSRLLPLFREVGNKMKNTATMTVLLTLTFAPQCWAKTFNADLFQQALTTILTDSAPLEVIEAATGELVDANANHYNLTPLVEEMKRQKNIKDNDMDEFRVLSFVNTVAEIGIVEAIDILLMRLKNHSTNAWRFDQWQQADIEALAKIAKAVSEKERLRLQTEATEVLFLKYKERPSTIEVIEVTLYSLPTLYKPPFEGRPNKVVLDFFDHHMFHPDTEVSTAAAQGFVGLASPDLIVKYWNEPAANQEIVRLHLAKALFIADSKSNAPEILALLRESATSDPSPRVREEANNIVRSLELRSQKTELTPEQRARIAETLEKSLNEMRAEEQGEIKAKTPRKPKTCPALFMLTEQFNPMEG